MFFSNKKEPSPPGDGSFLFEKNVLALVEGLTL